MGWMSHHIPALVDQGFDSVDMLLQISEHDLKQMRIHEKGSALTLRIARDAMEHNQDVASALCLWAACKIQV